MEKQLITGLEPGQVAEYVFLCGEPERVPKISSLMGNAEETTSVREFTVHSGTLEGVNVTVASTGIGGPSTAILVEELANLGAHTFIRIGTSGGIDEGLQKGDFVEVPKHGWKAFGYGFLDFFEGIFGVGASVRT